VCLNVVLHGQGFDVRAVAAVALLVFKIHHSLQHHLFEYASAAAAAPGSPAHCFVDAWMHLAVCPAWLLPFLTAVSCDLRPPAGCCCCGPSL